MCHRLGRLGTRDRRPAGTPGVAVVLACTVAAGGAWPAWGDGPVGPASGGGRYRFPTVPAEHEHARALLENAMRYVDPEFAMVDPASGYPLEGWNQDPEKGLFLRSFTQLTAIGLYLELLANVVAGRADTPHLPRDEARAQLARLVESLRRDQHDPELSADGLLVNFLDLATGKRLGPLGAEVEKGSILEEFGPERGEAIWTALQAEGWIEPRKGGVEAAIVRDQNYGYRHFDGALAPHRDEATRQRLMGILDRRVVMVVFGDNANLSASVAKAIGALLRSDAADDPDIAAVRRELEAFLDDQKAGYARLYDAEAGQFFFGWDQTHRRHFGWEDLEGRWVTGHMDYLVNEFRGPATFVAARFGIPADAIANLGFKMRPYQLQDGRTAHVLAPWEGSAFQALGLVISLGELEHPSWRRLLTDLVAVELDYATRDGLPGLLSESYTGDGVRYTGHVGIPEITVSPLPRITDAASLYALGAAYTVAPGEVERFLAANWPVISQLLTEHGPWEGFNVSTQEPIEFQTTAHTLALILGQLGTASGDMTAYLESRGLGGRLASFFKAGEGVDLLSAEAGVFAWDDAGATLEVKRDGASFRVQGEPAGSVGVAFVSPLPEGVDLSGGLLILRYRSATPIGTAVVALKPADAPATGLIPTEIGIRLGDTGGRYDEVRVPLPATPGLGCVKEVVITTGPESRGRPIELTISGLSTTPIGPDPSPAARIP